MSRNRARIMWRPRPTSDPSPIEQMAELMQTRRDGGRQFLLDVSKAMSERPDAEGDPEPPPLPPAQRTSHAPVVYYILFDRRCKIGTTTNLPRRLRELPHDALLATEPGGHGVERTRHRDFIDLHITGEWFRYDEPLRSHIDSLSTT